MTSPERIAKGMWWDRAWTLTKGCTPVSTGCAHCWSAAQSHIRSKQAKPPPCYTGVTDDAGKWNGVVESIPAMLDRPLHVRKPQTWAVWNDLFHEGITNTFIDQAWAVMTICAMHANRYNHTFQILTKRSARMREYVMGVNTRVIADIGANMMEDGDRWHDSIRHHMPKPLPNVHLGASASNQPDLDRVASDLSATPAAVRFLSLEPLLGEIELWHYDDFDMHMKGPCIESRGGKCGYVPGEPDEYWEEHDPGIDWVIVGAESGPHRRPCQEKWIEDITEQCEAAGVSCFVKQSHDTMSNVVKMPEIRGHVWDQLPEVKP